MAEQKIYKAIVGVMRDIGAIGKDQTNTFDKYKFRGIDDVYNALQPALVKNGVFSAPNLLELNQEDRVSRKGDSMIYTSVKVEYTFFADDGSYIKVVVPGEAADRSDKSINKAMSAAYKYACFQTFCIPTEEMKDADAESPEVGKKAEGTVKPKKNAPVQSKDDMNKPITKEQIAEIEAECKRIGDSIASMEQRNGRKITSLTRIQAEATLRVLRGRPSAAPVDMSVAENSELPWEDAQVSLNEL